MVNLTAYFFIKKKRSHSLSLNQRICVKERYTKMTKRLSLKQLLVALSDACFCINHLESDKIQVSKTEIKNGSVCPEEQIMPEEKKAIVGGRRIKVLITRKQLDRLLAKQVSLEQLAVMNQKTFLENKWMPRLESIHETPEL